MRDFCVKRNSQWNFAQIFTRCIVYIDIFRILPLVFFDVQNYLFKLNSNEFAFCFELKNDGISIMWHSILYFCDESCRSYFFINILRWIDIFPTGHPFACCAAHPLIDCLGSYALVEWSNECKVSSIRLLLCHMVNWNGHCAAIPNLYHVSGSRGEFV